MNKQNKYHVFFSNLANPLKIELITALKEGDKNVSQLTKELSAEQSKVSHALASLKECNIVNVKKEGKERIYFLNKKTILPMLKLIDEHAKLNCHGQCKHCDKH